MHAPQLIQIAAGAASLGCSIALVKAIAMRPSTVEGPARRRIGHAMLGFLVTVGLSLAVASLGPGY